MPTYRYEGAYPGGERVTGVVEALDQSDAVAQIRQSCEVAGLQQVLQRPVHKDVAHGAGGLDGVIDLGRFPLPDQVADGPVGLHRPPCGRTPT